MSLWDELKRRRVVRTGIAYLAATWLLLQVASIVLPTFEAPGWIMQTLIVSAAAGFPLALLLAWVYQITPEGLTKTANKPGPEGVASPRRLTVELVTAALVAGVLMGSGAVWLVNRDTDGQWARDVAIPEIYNLIDESEFLAAYALAEKVERLIPSDPILEQLWPEVSSTLSYSSDPIGADIYARPYDSDETAWRYLGKTPLTGERVWPGALRLRLENEGFEQSVVSVPSLRFGPATTLELAAEGSTPEGMVHVGSTSVSPWDILYGLHTAVEWQVPSFSIDKYEVTNAQFKEFVDAGGYENRAYWTHTFLTEDFRSISWSQAMTVFRDETGRPGPSTWRGGSYPDGEEDYPVAGVSWYEAAAYAEFIGRSLPTVHHWIAAASPSLAAAMVPFSNFDSDSASPATTEDGISRVGAFGMAGNAREWVANENGDSGERYILGGGWNDSSYSFLAAESRSPMDRARENGFRTLLYASADDALSLEQPVAPATRIPGERNPVSDEVFQSYVDQFTYEPIPLDAASEDISIEGTQWRVELVSFSAAYANERVPAYLFLPTHVDPPYQALLYYPDGGAPNGGSSSRIPTLYSDRFADVILSGRAILFPVYFGAWERRDTRVAGNWPSDSPTYREWTMRQILDAMRAVDYLESRPDIDAERLGFTGDSWGGERASSILALELRLKTAVLLSGGFTRAEYPAVVDPVNYAPRVTVPVLMMNGDQDSLLPRITAQDPMFALLGSAEKIHKVYSGGHGFYSDQSREVARETLIWLDRYLGQVD